MDGLCFKSKSSRTLHQILKSRQDKSRETRRFRQKDLQQSVLKLLDTHQDFDKLLQEVQAQNGSLKTNNTDNKCGSASINTSRIGPDDTSNATGCKGTTKFYLEVESMTSCLEHQANLTGVSFSQLAARKCATLVYESTLFKEKQDQEPVLNDDYRKNVELIVGLIKRLDAQHCFHRGQFIEVLNSQIQINHAKLSPWLLWLLHKEVIMPFDLFVTSHLKHPKVLSNMGADLANLMINSQGKDTDSRMLSQRIFIDTLTHFIQVAHPSKDAPSFGDTRDMTESVNGILDTVFARFIEAAIDRRVEQLEDHDILLPMEQIQRRVPKESCHQFSSRHIAQLLCHSPTFTVTDAINRQHEWSFAKASPNIVGLFKQLLIPLQESDAVGLLRRVLDQEEVNWQLTLIYTSTIVIYYPLAQQLIKKCISDFIEQAFESYEEDLLICAFLLVRQAANEGPHVFPSYAAWFKETFSSSSSPTSAHRKAFSFLMEFLTKLVPHETAVSLRAHVQNPPNAPGKCQEILRDYLLLAKTRLSDLNESWQDSGVPGANKPSTGVRSARPQDQARNDVDIAIESYEKNNRIPTNVLEASIFRRPYYVTHFLPALLTPRMLPDIADAKMKLIESLKCANKIPVALYQHYEEACAKELNELLDGAFSEDAIEDCLEPLDALKAGLDKLRGMAVQLKTSQPNSTTVIGEFTAQVTLLSDKLATALGLDGTPSQPRCDVAATMCVDLKEIKPNALHKEVAEIILDAFGCICKDVDIMKEGRHRGVGMETNQMKMIWAHQLVSMLSGFTELCTALYHRVWMLLCQQVPSQTDDDDAIVGSACFLLFTHTLRSQFPSACGTTNPSIRKTPCSLLEVISSELSISTSQQMLFAARFTSALLHLSLCHSARDPGTESLNEKCRATQLPPAALEKFCFLIPRICYDMRCFPDEHHMEDDSMDATQNDLLLTAGQSVFSSTLFKTMLPESKLTFSQWISYELSVSPHADILTDLERHDYHQWAILCYFLPLPTTQGGCGGCHHRAVQTLINSLMDHEIRDNHQTINNDDDDDRVDDVSHRRHHRHHGGVHSCWRELLQSLQELIPLVSLSQVDIQKSGDHDKSHDSWLLSVFHERQAKMRNIRKESSVVCFSSETLEVHAFLRVTCCLPPYHLFCSHIDISPRQKDLKALSRFIGLQLREHCMESWGSLPYLVTAHLIKGIVTCFQKTGDTFLQPFLSSAPLLLASVIVHWRRIKPFIVQAYRQGPMPTVFQSIQDLYTAAEGLADLAKGSPSPTSIGTTTSSSSTSTKLEPPGKGSSSSSSSSSSYSSGAAAITFCSVAIATPPWLCAVALHEAVRRGCSMEERSSVLTAVLQMVSRDSQDNREICLRLLECVVAEEAWNVLCGKTCQQQPFASQAVTQHVTFLIQLVQTPSVLQQSIFSRSVIQLHPLVIVRSFLAIRSQMQPLLSQHAHLMDVLLETHNALVELYYRSGGEPLQPTRGLRRIFKPDKGDVLSTDLMLTCSRFLQSCVSVCPPANLRRIKTEILAKCSEEIRATVRRYAQDRK